MNLVEKLSKQQELEILEEFGKARQSAENDEHIKKAREFLEDLRSSPYYEKAYESLNDARDYVELRDLWKKTSRIEISEYVKEKWLTFIRTRDVREYRSTLEEIVGEVEKGKDGELAVIAQVTAVYSAFLVEDKDEILNAAPINLRSDYWEKIRDAVSCLIKVKKIYSGSKFERNDLLDWMLQLTDNYFSKPVERRREEISMYFPGYNQINFIMESWKNYREKHKLEEDFKLANKNWLDFLKMWTYLGIIDPDVGEIIGIDDAKVSLSYELSELQREFKEYVITDLKGLIKKYTLLTNLDEIIAKFNEKIKTKNEKIAWQEFGFLSISLLPYWIVYVHREKLKKYYPNLEKLISQKSEGMKRRLHEIEEIYRKLPKVKSSLKEEVESLYSIIMEAVRPKDMPYIL